MLYQTHQPLSFQFHPISSSYSSSIPHLFANKQSFASASAFLSPCLPTVQAETEMECVEAALKTSFRKDLAMKLTPQSFIDELSAFNVQNVAPCDDFSVDDLLDFSHEEEAVLEEEQEEKEDNKVVPVSVSGSAKQENPSCEISYPGFNSSVKDDFECLPSSELSVPADDLASLEWLSHFVEDSFSEYSAAFPAGILPEKPKNYSEDGPEPESPVWNQPCFKTPVPAKARSKRTRTGVRVWPLGSPTITESSSSSTSSSSSSSPSPWLIYPNLAQNLDQLCSEVKPPAKKPKKKPTSEGSSSQTPRRCSHCGVQKTPQWRTGPLGAKTLCNACGVRYKSGRLLPEYRPACSPTFSSELHSNHHRKVLEMRRKKETMGGVESGLTPAPVVPSF